MIFLLYVQFLIVEDSKSTNKILTQYFKHKFYIVLSVFTLSEAYKILASQTINYILLDMNLPDGSGYELLKLYSNKGIKFFVLTSDDDIQLKEVSYQNGVIDFILKDKDFYKKISQIDSSIKLLEKNKEKSILVVDDSTAVTTQLKDIFENRNYKVFTSATTHEALEILNQNQIDLIVLGLETKDDNSVVFLLQNAPIIFKTIKIPVIILSSNITSSTIRDGIKAGAIEVMKKPYVIEEMILKI
ncbi:MAG: response regulator [Arcobacter sp.]|nr:response regulator [Arcobacter sp.]